MRIRHVLRDLIWSTLYVLERVVIGVIWCLLVMCAMVVIIGLVSS